MLRLATLMVLACPALSAQEVKHARLIGKIDSIARKAMTDGHIPGLSIGVSRGKETILARGYGFARLQDSARVDSATIFPIASITKQFTAAAILQLDEANKVNLRDNLSKYLPSFPAEPGEKITIQQLLNHTGGIPNETPTDSGPAPTALDFTPEEFLSVFGKLPREFPAGEKFVYTNSGYYLLGLVIEAVTGQSYASYIKERLMAPVGMAHSGECGDRPAGMATGYNYRAGSWVAAGSLGPGRLYAAAGLCSNTVDLLRWSRALYDRKVVNLFSWKQMIEPAELKDGSRASYGYGMTLGRLGKHTAVGHGGSIQGFSSQLTIYPEQQVTVVVLANSERAVTRRIADQVAIAVLGVVQPKVKDLPVPLDDLDRYTGTFDLAGDVLEVFAEDGKLMMRINGTDGILLLYQGSNEFATEPDPATKLYFRISQGRARTVVFSAGGLTLNANRK